MSNLSVFQNSEFGSVRIIKQSGEPWFVAKDVCDILGTDTRDIPDILDQDEQLPLVGIVHTLKNSSGLRKDSRIVSESGLYSLIFRSRKPEAKAFRRWVTHEVLPSIRKTGRYSVESATLLPYQVIRTLPKSMKDRLNDLVNTKLAHVPATFGLVENIRTTKQQNTETHFIYA